MTRSENKLQRQTIYLERLTIVALLVAVGGAILTPLLPFLAPHLLRGKEYLNIWSNLGEYVGGIVGALLSFATILLLILTINEQRHAYLTSVKSLEQQILEMQQMRRIHEEQQFEVTFFQALNGHNELVKSFELPLPGGKWANGRICLRYMYRDFEEKCRGNPSVEEIFDRFSQFSRSDQLIIRQFIQSIEKLISFTHEYEVDVEVKRDLLGFISAQLTYHEEFFFLLHLAAQRGESALTDFVVLHRLFDCQAEPPFTALNHTPLFSQSA